MPDSVGTRSKQNFQLEHPEGGSDTRTRNPDLGMSKRVISTATFTASDGRITGSNGDFTAFAVGDTILVQGVNLNNGIFNVLALDVTNQAYLKLDPAPKNEGPISATVRTA